MSAREVIFGTGLIIIVEVYFRAREHLNIYKNAASWLRLKSSRILGQISDPVLTAPRSAGHFKGRYRIKRFSG